MADDTSWVPQKPREPRALAPVYHTRSSSIGWRNNLPFRRKRRGSAAEAIVDREPDLKDNDAEMVGSSIVQGLRKRGTRAFKRSNTANDISLAAAGIKDRSEKDRVIPAKVVTAVQTPAIVEPKARDSKLAIPEELTKELNKLAAARKSKSFDDLNGQKNIPTRFAKGPTEGFWENPREVPGASRRLSRSPGRAQATATEQAPTRTAPAAPTAAPTARVRTASLSPHPPYTSPRPQSAWQPSASPRPTSVLPRPRSVSPQPPQVHGLPSSPRPPAAEIARSRSVSPRPPSARGLPASPRPPSASPRPSGPNNSWQQEALASARTESHNDPKKDNNLLKIVTEFSPLTPESARSVTPRTEEIKEESPSEKTVDGIEFEMLPTPKRFSLHSSRLFLDDERPEPVPELPQFLALPTPGLPKESAVFSPSLTLSPETADRFMVPPPPPIPDTPSPTGRRRRWTVVSSARASSILLPSTFEQPETPRWKAHKRASSENDADTMEVEYKDGVILVPTRPPTPPPKTAGLPSTPGPFTRRKSSLSYARSVKAARSMADLSGSKTPTTPTVPAVPITPGPFTAPAVPAVPPVCAKGTLPQPRSKYNPHAVTQPKPQQAVAAPPVPSVPASTGARIAAAAAKALSAATVSRSVSLKTKPPGRSPPPVPALPNAGKARTSPPTRAPSNSSALKRRSSGSDKDGKQITDRVKKSVAENVGRTRSQVRRDFAKKMALDNIGAFKMREAPKTSTRAKSPARPTTSGRTTTSPLRPATPPRPNTADASLSRKPSTMRLEMPLETKVEPGAEAEPEVPALPALPALPVVLPGEPTSQLQLPESSQEMRNSLQKIQTAEMKKITSLAAELKKLEEQCDKARQHQKALHEARQRLQDIPDSPTNSTSSDSSDASAQSCGSSSARSIVLAQLDCKIEKWRKEVQQTEHKRNRIRKKLAWHSADRLKLVPTKAKPAPANLAQARPASMFSPTSVYSVYSEDGGVVLPPLPSFSSFSKLNSASGASHSRNASASSHRPQHSRNVSSVSKHSTRSRDPSVASKRSNHSRNVSEVSAMSMAMSTAGVSVATTAKRTNHSAAPSLDNSFEARPSVDENVMDSQPPTPKEITPPLTSANKPWVGLEANPFLAAPPPSLPEPPAGIDGAKSPISVIGAGPDRQTIQLFASEDIMEDIRSAESNGSHQLISSPVPRFDRQITIQVFADAGITDLVSALQEEIENMGREGQWE